MLIEYKNESVAVKEMRRHIGAYLKGMPKAAEYRGRFHQTEPTPILKKTAGRNISKAAEKISRLKTVKINKIILNLIANIVGTL